MIKLLPLERLEGIGGVLCHGTFDLFHVGHLHYLKEAKKFGNPLTVTLTAGEFIRHHGPGRPVFSDSERLEMIEALDFVNWISLVYDVSAVPAIVRIRPKIYCKGDETRREGNAQLEMEMAAVSELGGKTVFIPKVLPYSSGRLLSGEMLRERTKEVA